MNTTRQKNIIALIGLAAGMSALGAVPADLKLPAPEISRAARVRCKAVTSALVPKALHVSAEEAAAITARNMADRAASGYVERYPYHSGHYTSRLLKRFWNTHREYFGLMPNGQRGVDLPGWPSFFRALSKACVSNEAVVDQKIADWVAAGKPQLFICGEDDGLLDYCRCAKCCALDADLPGERFIHHKTDRYINFWNRVCAKAVKLRPDVIVSVFAYSVLRHPPRREKIAYPDNMRFSFIPTFHDADKLGMVAAWKKAGMKHFHLRPNYLCPRLHMPYGLERTIYDEIRAFMAAGASGFQFDGGMAIPVQKFEIYVTERLSSDPNVPFAEIERDYCARYGAAAETVKAYHRRVRERCDREWPRLRVWMKENDLEFLDDGHICRCIDRLHTVGELEEDVAELEKFDASRLTGEAARRFDELKANARHYVLVKRALQTKSAADKKALLDFRIANRLALGTGWVDVYKKGEVSLWFPGTKHEEYMKFGEEAFAEAYEQNMKPPTNTTPWVSADEREFVRRRTERIDTRPGTPEPDAIRFYSSTGRNEYVSFNYDESKAGVLGVDYTLEAPLTFFDGRKVESADDWRARRKEILSFYERNVYGRFPSRPDAMVFELVSEKPTAGGQSIERRYRQWFRADKSGPVIDWLLVLPRAAKKPCPVILHLNYHGNDKVAAGRTNHFELPLGEIGARGYAFMSACYKQITSDGDGKDGRVYDGVCELFGPRDFARKDNSGSLIVWAWGLCRGLDLAEKIAELDARRNVVIGSSRLGKAALLAAAYDERFAVCVPNQTGAVGVQLMKRDYGETLKGQRLSLPHWYCANVWQYADEPRKQPFDQHLLLSCVAPRALLLECYHKKWFDPKGEWLAAQAAAPVWKFLTGRTLNDVQPAAYDGKAVCPPFGYARRTGTHGLSSEDWKWALDFADRALW